MKFVSFQVPGGAASYGLVEGNEVVDLGATRPAAPTLKDFLATPEFQSGKIATSGPRHPLSSVRFLPVVPNPGKIICVGLNYQDHVHETGRSDSAYPVLFLRTPSSQTGHLQPLVKSKVTEKFDYEGELALIIGKPGRHIAASDALSHVAGYACYNDGTGRDWQRHTHQFTPGKNFDETGAFGPWMIPAADLGKREDTWLITRVNGVEYQKARLSQMIFSIEELIVYISGFTKLETGDVIVTGTPGGVGDRAKPPHYLTAGDKVEIEVTGLGVLENSVVDETA
jgi:2-keto-4-pentenoate hydratase/2-oxohepta-3-ene-1,7-dioic acid hydratase in catechol pathway